MRDTFGVSFDMPYEIHLLTGSRVYFPFSKTQIYHGDPCFFVVV